uniref:Uncharacterized protein n=1 Tax=Cyprinodon variegatus TaxID=28743 RepID=A0A3Q2E0J8_CYPVA
AGTKMTLDADLCVKLQSNESVLISIELISRTSEHILADGGRNSGVAGGVVSWMTSKPFRPLYQILGDLSWKQKKKLFVHIMKDVLWNVVWNNAKHLVTIVKASAKLMEMVLCILATFITVELGYKVYYVKRVTQVVQMAF